MKSKRFLAAVAAVCVPVAPAAFAATTATTSSATSAGSQTAPSPKARAAARQRALHDLAYRRHVRLIERARSLGVRDVRRGYERRARFRSLGALQRSNARLRQAIAVERRQRRMYRAAIAAVPRATLRAIAACESRHNPRAIGGGGRYRGLFQMTFAIWSAVGGRGDPAAASVREQYLRAALVYRRYGAGQWPVCGR